MITAFIADNHGSFNARSCSNSFGFKIPRLMKIIRVPLTLSFQHVQFNEGGVHATR